MATERASRGFTISAVVVSYNTRALLRDCLRSIYHSTVVPNEVFVVDNASSDGSVEMVRAEFPGVTVIALERNLGFAGANNIALRQFSGSRVLLLNPDAVLAPDALGTLSAALTRWSHAAAVGPYVKNPDGSTQSCGYRFPTLLGEIRQSRRIDRALGWVAGPNVPQPPATAEGEVDWADGCCLLIRREALAAVGLLDEQYFLYTEELDWCFNARKAGWQIVAVPTATVKHHRGQSSASTGTGSLTTALMVETRLRYYRKNYTLSTALAAAVVLGMGFLKQWRSDPRGSRAKLAGIGRWVRAATRRRPALAHAPSARVA
jgi:GT2 family glycosyltransferase